MKRSRSPGYAGSSGRYAPPAFRIPRSPTTISRDRSTHSPTSTSGPTPRFLKYLASRLARSFNWPYVSRLPSNSTATASGALSACSSKSPCTVLSLGYSVSVWFHSTRT